MKACKNCNGKGWIWEVTLDWDSWRGGRKSTRKTCPKCYGQGKK